MNTEKNFDEKAVDWDANVGRVKVAADIARTILREIRLTSEMDVLDFGCGTGLISLALLPSVRSVTGVDSSPGMLDVFRRKIVEGHLKNVNTLYLDPEKDGILTGRFHVIVSSMTLHHIRQIEPLLEQFHHVLYPGGQVCIADLDLDGGRFHSGTDGVFHPGFHRMGMRRKLLDAGFQDIRVTEAAQIEKPVDSGETKRFSVFLMTGRK